MIYKNEKEVAAIRADVDKHQIPVTEEEYTHLDHLISSYKDADLWDKTVSIHVPPFMKRATDTSLAVMINLKR